MKRFAVFLGVWSVIVCCFVLPDVRTPKSQVIRKAVRTTLKDLGPRNSDIVRVNGRWPDLVANRATYGQGNNSYREYLIVTHQGRIRQDGDILQIAGKWGGTTLVDSIFIKIWRHSVGQKYTLIGISDNMGSTAPAHLRMVPLTIHKVTLDNPITGVQRGDNYSIRCSMESGIVTTAHFSATIEDDKSGNPSVDENTLTVAYLDRDVFPVTRATPAGLYNWQTDSSDGFQAPFKHENVRINFFMRAPLVVVYGASINAGHSNSSISGAANNNFTFDEPVILDSIAPFEWTDTSLVSLNTTIMYHLSQLTGWWPWQNLSLGSERITSASSPAELNRRVLDLKPRLVITGRSSNDSDLNASGPIATKLASLSAMMDSFNDDSSVRPAIKMVYRSFMPRAKFPASRFVHQREVDSLLAAYQIAIEEHAGDFVYVPIRSGMGNEDVTSGPPGNRWNLKPIYDGGDSIHGTPLAHELIAHKIFRALSLGEPVPTVVP